MSTIVNNTRNENLKFVDNLDDYKVHHDDVDIRGYKIKDTTGNTIGEVEGLLADVPSKLVRYVEVEIDDDVISRHTSGRYQSDDKHALIPVGIVNINKSDNSVTLSGIGIDHFIDYPRYNRERTGYTTRYEIDTNDYLAGFHEYGNTYNRDLYSTDEYRNSSRLDDGFYGSKFYTTR